MDKKKSSSRKPLFVAYSDIHHNIWPTFNEDNKRIKVSLEAEKIIFNKAYRLKVDILFCGDLVHNEKVVSNDLLGFILPHYSKLNGEIEHSRFIGISGNHDQSKISKTNNPVGSYVRTLHNTFNNFHCIDFSKITVHRYDTYVVWGIPYITHDMGLGEYIEGIAGCFEKGKKNILMLHTTLPKSMDTDGRLMQTNSLGNEFMALLDKFDLVLTGHIHKPMIISEKIIQLGAPNQQRKTDINCEMGYWIIYEDLSYKFKPLDLPKFVKLKTGEELPNGSDYYYYEEEHKKKEFKHTKDLQENFSDINNTRVIAKNYLKHKSINDKGKKKALIEALKKGKDD